MRLADPVHNVELRRAPNGHDSVVFAFPYRPDLVDAVRAIPGRRHVFHELRPHTAATIAKHVRPA